MPEKVYTPEIIEENPFPGETSEVLGMASDTPAAGKVYSPSVAPTNTVRAKKIATELLSRALNTSSKKILQEFDLISSGGFKIGDYKEGTSGDLRLTPNGITARDNAGLTTFSIEALTGNATFKGIIQAGAVVSGAVQVGDQSILIDGATKRMIFYDDDGLASILIGEL